MYLFFLLILTLLLFKTLFSTFGFTTTQDLDKRDKAIKNFIKNVSKTKNDENSDNDKNNIKNTYDVNFFENIYNNYNNKNNINIKSKKTVEVFDENKFLKLSERAVVMILNSFSDNNSNVLKELLTYKMFSVFEKNILQNVENNTFYKTIIVSIDDKKIIDKTINNNFSSITLSLNMKQINYIENNENEIISGSKDKINIVNETWTFVKTNNDKYWLLDNIE